jgi:cell division protein FtsQ
LLNDKLPGSERDVLLDTPSKTSRVRTSIIGDKKLTAQDAFARRSNTEQKSTHEKPKYEQASRAVFDDVIAPRAEQNLRRERGYHKVSPQKKSVHETRAVTTHAFLYRGLGLLILVIGFACIAYFSAKPIATWLERPLKSVAVEGQFNYLPKDRAMELITAEIDGDFMQLNLDRLKNVLQADPWIERVSLSRRWPDTLVVKIAEQQPIARWDADGFLNQSGEIIRVKEVDKLLGLPWLQGNEINAREIMQQYQDLSTLLRTRGLEIMTLSCDNKKSWRVMLKNGVEIVIGRDQVMEKLQRFVTAYDEFLSGVWGDVQAIDVRYTNGVAVRWVPDSAMAKKYVKPELSLVKNKALTH